jgi:hypothetical protein
MGVATPTQPTMGSASHRAETFFEAVGNFAVKLGQVGEVDGRRAKASRQERAMGWVGSSKRAERSIMRSSWGVGLTETLLMAAISRRHIRGPRTPSGVGPL